MRGPNKVKQITISVPVYKIVFYGKNDRMVSEAETSSPENYLENEEIVVISKEMVRSEKRSYHVVLKEYLKVLESIAISDEAEG